MKYENGNKPKQCFMRQSTWYRSVGKIPVRGVLWHSTGANNPTLKRYVQPDDAAGDRSYWLGLLGKNIAGNDWNHITVKAGVNAFIGKLANGEVTTVQVGEWGKKAWGCGSGARGSCNDGWIQFEICEDALSNRTYFDTVYREAVELTAYLCKLYNLNPQGTVVHNGVTVPVILCHQDSYKLGLGSNHSDVLHWFKRFGKTMQDVRDDVAALLKEPAPVVKTDTEEDENMTLDKFKELMKEYRAELQDNDCGTWSVDARDWAIKNGMIQGIGNDKDGNPNYAWADGLTREQMCVLLYRFAKLIGKA